MTMLTETRERFLKHILSKVPAASIAEIHFFSPIKQGGVESGVAVVAAWPEERHPEEASAFDRHPEGAAATEGPLEAAEEPLTETPPAKPARPIIYTARYRLVLKGPDRGKWETNIVAEADAPLVTVDAVVRGVQRRSGDVDDPTRMEGDDIRAALEGKTAPGVPNGPAAVAASPITER